MKKNLLNNDKLLNYLIEEFRNSVNHSRHLETQRSKHIAFFFTFLAATVGFITTLMGFNQMTILKYLGIYALFLVDALVGLIVLAAVKKLGFALNRHSNKIYWIREQITQNEDFDHDMMCGDADDDNKFFQSKIFSTQLSAEYILASVVFLLLGLVLYLSFYLSFNSSIQNSVLVLIFILPIALFIYWFFVAFSKTGYTL